MASIELAKQRWQHFKTRLYDLRTENPAATADDLVGVVILPLGAENPFAKPPQLNPELAALREVIGNARKKNPHVAPDTLIPESRGFIPNRGIMDLQNKLNDKILHIASARPDVIGGNNVIQFGYPVSENLHLAVKRELEDNAIGIHIFLNTPRQERRGVSLETFEQLYVNSLGELKVWDVFAPTQFNQSGTSLVGEHSRSRPSIDETARAAFDRFQSATSILLGIPVR